jgi:hypothetical protein
MPYFI